MTVRWNLAPPSRPEAWPPPNPALIAAAGSLPATPDGLSSREGAAARAAHLRIFTEW